MLQRSENGLYLQDGYGDRDEINDENHYFAVPKMEPVIIDGTSLNGYQWHHKHHLDIKRIMAFEFKKPIYEQSFETFSVWCSQFGWQNRCVIWLPRSLIRAFHVIKGFGSSEDPRSDNKVRNHSFSTLK